MMMSYLSTRSYSAAATTDCAISTDDRNNDEGNDENDTLSTKKSSIKSNVADAASTGVNVGYKQQELQQQSNILMRRRSDNNNSSSSIPTAPKQPNKRIATSSKTINRRLYETVIRSDDVGEVDTGETTTTQVRRGNTRNREDNSEDHDDNDYDNEDNDNIGNSLSNIESETDGIFFQPLEIDSTNVSTQHHHIHNSLDGEIFHRVSGINSGSGGYSAIAGGRHLVLLIDWKDPWLPISLLTLMFIIPVLLGNALMFYNLIGRIWVITPFAIHTLASAISVRILIKAPPTAPLSYSATTTSTGSSIDHHHSTIASNSRRNRILSSFSSIADIVFFGFFYPLAWKSIVKVFTEVDGESVIEWKGYVRRFTLCLVCGYVIVLCRILIGVVAMVMRLFTVVTWAERFRSCHSRVFLLPLVCVERFVVATKYLVPVRTQSSIRQLIRCLFTVLVILSASLVVASITSGVNHLVRSWPSPSDSVSLSSTVTSYWINSPGSVDNSDVRCDPIDETECWLPFPSFHHLVEDASTLTGYRLNLRPDVLPTLKGAIPLGLKPNVSTNTFDGFSTMAPILFYVNGLKEAHESDIHQLPGQLNISRSTTNDSVTVLINVKDRILIPHSAEIDYLDERHPLVMVFPSRPLAHNTHYALAVINAVNAQHERIKPSEGMRRLLFESQLTASEQKRRDRYVNILIPAIEHATGPSWFNFTNDPQSLQLLFDFPTISDVSQLGPVRLVRDSTIRQITDPKWDWSNNVRTVSITDSHCTEKQSTVARVVHAELTVPWFLTNYGVGSRGAKLDMESVHAPKAKRMGNAKFVVVIPCSVKAAALAQFFSDTTSNTNTNSTSNVDVHEPRPIRAIVEYGHGLFANRGEVFDDFLQGIANDEGYIMTAMDWRGMSSYDLLFVARVLLSAPLLFEAIRDNLIQGFANKFALQHFSRHKLLDMDWLKFADPDDKFRLATKERYRSPPTYENKKPSHVFYGISQGGILGAGYSALSGVTKLIDLSVLGVPGTPFALIMSRSLDFKLYDMLLLFNFYDNRHVRTFLSLAQLYWDSVEASGVLATPVTEPYPPTLIQAGLGDAIVTTFAAESLARAYNANILPMHPRQDIFGIPVALNTTVTIANTSSPTSTTNVVQYLNSNDNQPLQVVLTEILYEQDFALLPEDNTFANKNQVHLCVRRDATMIRQVTKFINTGEILNVCQVESCIRNSSTCQDPKLGENK